MLAKIFRKERNIIIGALHFPPLIGYNDFPGLEKAEDDALADLMAFEQGGVNGVIFENNYDIPHHELVDSEIIAVMTFLGEKIRKATKLPLGVNVLWNDYRVSLSIAKVLNLQFIRVPVFVDKVKTSCGIITGQPQEIIAYRKKIGAENVAFFTDIHVKHSEILSKTSLVESARLAIEEGSDALIITGNWTGQSPDLSELQSVREVVGSFPILTGSGTDKDNIKEVFQFANGTIVSTSLKEGAAKKEETNVKSWHQRIDKEKVKELIEIIKD